MKPVKQEDKEAPKKKAKYVLTGIRFYSSKLRLPKIERFDFSESEFLPELSNSDSNFSRYVAKPKEEVKPWRCANHEENSSIDANMNSSESPRRNYFDPSLAYEVVSQLADDQEEDQGEEEWNSESQEVKESEKKERSLLYHRKSEEIDVILNNFHEHLETMMNMDLCNKLNVVDPKKPPEEETFIFGLSNPEINYYYQEAKKPEVTVLRPYETIYPEFTDKQIGDKILELVAPIVKEKDLKDSHRSKIDLLYRDLYPYTHEYAEKHAIEEEQRREKEGNIMSTIEENQEQEENSEGRGKPEPIIEANEEEEPREQKKSEESKLKQTVEPEQEQEPEQEPQEQEPQQQEPQQREQEIQIPEEAKTEETKKKINIIEIREYLKNNFPPKIQQKLEKMDDETLENMYFEISKEYLENKKIKQGEMEVIDERRIPRKKVIVENREGIKEAKTIEAKVEKYVKEVQRLFGLVQDLVPEIEF